MFTLDFKGTKIVDVDTETDVKKLRLAISWLAYEHGKETGLNYRLEKQIAELQENLKKASNEMDRRARLNAEYLHNEVCQRQEIEALKAKVHRRNLQIADLRKEVASLRGGYKSMVNHYEDEAKTV